MSSAKILSEVWNVLTLNSILLLYVLLYIEGCKTYRRSLAEKPKSMSTPVKKKKQLRSLKQRVSNGLHAV